MLSEKWCHRRVACHHLEIVSLFQEFAPRSMAPWSGISAIAVEFIELPV